MSWQNRRQNYTWHSRVSHPAQTIPASLNDDVKIDASLVCELQGPVFILNCALIDVDDQRKSQMARYTDSVSPLTDLAVVYGTEGFEMGFGFVTVALPQVSKAYAW